MKHIDNLAKVLAVLVAEGNYTYVDKIGYAPSKDLLAFYLKEALRDFHSLVRGEAKNSKVKNFLNDLKGELESGAVDLDRSISEFMRDVPEDDRQKLRESSSLLAARALAISTRFIE